MVTELSEGIFIIIEEIPVLFPFQMMVYLIFQGILSHFANETGRWGNKSVICAEIACYDHENNGAECTIPGLTR